MKVLFGGWLAVLLLLYLALPAAVQAQFTFVTNNGAITITGCTGFGVRFVLFQRFAVDKLFRSFLSPPIAVSVTNLV